MIDEYGIGILARNIGLNCICYPIEIGKTRGAHVLAQYEETTPLGTRRLDEFERIGHKFITQEGSSPDAIVRGLETIFGNKFHIGVLMTGPDNTPVYATSNQ
jgi:hypothetical protein